MKSFMDLGTCTMDDCKAPAKWVHGIPMTDGSGRELFPWRLCDCCWESVLAAHELLHGDMAAMAGIVDPDGADWCFEACKVSLAQMKKLEDKK